MKQIPSSKINIPGKVILLVDDDDDDKQLFSEAAAEVDSSLVVVTASNGLEAIKILNTSVQLPDFIFLDLNMPSMNGKQCLAEIKKKDRLSTIPVIIYSTSKIQKDVEEVYKLGAIWFFKKPSSFEEICDGIRHVISGEWKKKEMSIL